MELGFYHLAAPFCEGDGQFPCAAADRRVSVHRAPSEPAEEHDVVHPVLLSHGAHVLHPFHVHGEPAVRQTATHNLSVSEHEAVLSQKNRKIVDHINSLVRQPSRPRMEIDTAIGAIRILGLEISDYKI